MELNLRHKFLLTVAIVISMLVICCILSVELNRTEAQLGKLHEIRYNSYVLAIELRTSSEDLTTLARTFVATGDESYEKAYQDILNWRSGNAPRPQSFSLHPGEKINQMDIMKELGFSDAEFAKLEESTGYSNDLVATEVKAMNAIHGLEPDGKTPYQGKEPAKEMALRIMFDEKYHENKATIMAPIEDFFALLDERTLSDVKAVTDWANLLSAILILILIITGIVYALTVRYVLTAIVEPIRIAEANLTKVANDDLTVQWETDRTDEIGNMATAFTQMVGVLKQNQVNIQTNLDAQKKTNADIVRIIDGVNQGRLNNRIASEGYEGEYLQIVSGINSLLDNVVNPLHKAMSLASEYANGDFSSQMDESISYNGDFLEFKDSMNQIGIQTSKAIGDVRTEVDALTAGMEETNASVEEVASSTGMLAQSSASVSALAEKSDDGIRQTMTAMEDLSNTVGAVASKAEQASSMANQTVDLSEKGVALAGKAEKGMEAIMHSTDETAVIIGDITSQMDEIGKIVDVITSIAEQTGLLALNAAIEAARAGDAGMGFAVVADEVKSLALESQKSAENISTIIDNLQKKSKQVSDSMQASAEEVRIGTLAVNDTLEVFNQIVEAINVVHANMTEVAGATEEQAAVVEEITASVNEIGDMVQSTAKEAVDSAAATEEVTAAIDQITRAINDAAVSVQKIADEMEGFKVR